MIFVPAQRCLGTVKLAGGPIWNAHTPADLLPMQQLCAQFQSGWQVQNGVLVAIPN